MNAVLVNIILNFAVAVIGMLFVAWVSRWIAGNFTGPDSSRVAAFAATIGYAVGEHSVVKPLGTNNTGATASALGALVGLVVVWFVLFKRSASHGDA